MWRLTVDRAKEGSGLDVEREPKWFPPLAQFHHCFFFIITDSHTILFYCVFLC